MYIWDQFSSLLEHLEYEFWNKNTSSLYVKSKQYILLNLQSISVLMFSSNKFLMSLFKSECHQFALVKKMKWSQKHFFTSEWVYLCYKICRHSRNIFFIKANNIHVRILWFCAFVLLLFCIFVLDSVFICIVSKLAFSVSMKY